MAKKKSRSLLVTLLIAAAGFVAGILTAPKSGKETREEIVKDTKKVVSTTKKTAANVKAKTVEVKNRSQQAVAGAKAGYQKAPAKKTSTKK